MTGEVLVSYLSGDEDAIINNYPGYVNEGSVMYSETKAGILSMGLKVSVEWISYVHMYGSRSARTKKKESIL